MEVYSIGKCSISAAINHVQQLSSELRELGGQQAVPSRWGKDYERGVCVCSCSLKILAFSIIKVKTWKKKVTGIAKSMSRFAAVVKLFVQCKLISLITNTQLQQQRQSSGCGDAT